MRVHLIMVGDVPMISLHTPQFELSLGKMMLTAEQGLIEVGYFHNCKNYYHRVALLECRLAAN